MHILVKISWDLLITMQKTLGIESAQSSQKNVGDLPNNGAYPQCRVRDAICLVKSAEPTHL